MGAERLCKCTSGKMSSEGRALFETDEILFRGDFRLCIPLREIDDVKVVDDKLCLRWKAGAASLALGAKHAARWAEKIRAPKGRLDKLGVKSGQRVSLVGESDPDFLAELAARDVAIASGRAPTQIDHLFFFVATPRDLDRIPSLAKSLRPDGALWLVRPKGKDAPVGERESMAAGRAAGLVDVKVVAFSPTHSASKYVIPLARR